LAFDLRNPDAVKLTARSERLLRDHFLVVLKRRFRENLTRTVKEQAVAQYGADAPIVAVAIDLAETTGPLADELRSTVARILASLPGARLTCLTVFKLGIISLDNTLDEQGHSKHVQSLIELRHWAEPLKLEEGRVSVHVLESPRPAEAILSYARSNHVNHIVMGARAESTKRSLLGSVSGGDCPCTVTVVRRAISKCRRRQQFDDQSEVSWCALILLVVNRIGFEW
jgi:nucleotide-binding universal stress UspA family protein